MLKSDISSQREPKKQPGAIISSDKDQKLFNNEIAENILSGEKSEIFVLPPTAVWPGTHCIVSVVSVGASDWSKVRKYEMEQLCRMQEV